MTPQERQLVADLFDRLATLENRPRDPQAEAAIADGMRRAPNALYALVQTVLVQDEALRAADARIRELEAGADAGESQGGFLDSMRDTFLGGRNEGRGSVPAIGRNRPAPAWQGGAQPAPMGQPQPQGGSFLGTAAAAAAGVIGGSLLLNSFRGMFGGGQQAAAMDQSGANAERGSPWGDSASSSDLAREAGANDVGSRQQTALNDPGSHDDAGDDSYDSDDFDSDFDGGDSDFG
ncbi:MAG: DUF2076 domain-containing protein [Pseudorhodoplanes sp.]|nr:DUF2076 domain-containing protein [Pseudorhodoplanes sp.]